MASGALTNGDPVASEEHDASRTGKRLRAAAESAQPPPSYETTVASASAQDTAETRPQSNNSARAWTIKLTTVSMLPADSAAPGWPYNGDCEDHAMKSVGHTGSNKPRHCRPLAARAYTAIAKKVWKLTRRHQACHYHYRDESGRAVSLSITDGIRPGEVERPITTRYDWTADWDWILTLQWGDTVLRQDMAHRLWWGWAFVYINKLPDLLRETIPGKGVQLVNVPLISQHEDHYRFRYAREWAFCESAERPRWRANVRVAHNNYYSFIHVNSPLSFLGPDRILG